MDPKEQKNDWIVDMDHFFFTFNNFMHIFLRTFFPTLR